MPTKQIARVKNLADQQVEENQFFVNSIWFNSHKKLLADSLIERECQSLIMHASNSSLVTIQLLLTSKSGPSSCLVTAIHSISINGAKES